MGILDEKEFDDVMKLQRQLASSAMDEFEMDAKIRLLTIFDEVAHGRKKIQTEKLLIEAESQGMSEFEVMSVLDKLKKDDLIFEPQTGYLQKY